MPYEIEFIKGHRDSKGELAPWVIKKKDTKEIVGSSKSREKAVAAIAARTEGEKK